MNIFEEIISELPHIAGNRIRHFYWSWKYDRQIHIGKGVTIRGDIEFGDSIIIMDRCYLYSQDHGSIKIGSNLSINTNVQLGAADGGKIIIGDNVLIGPNVVIRASSHEYWRLDIPIREQGHKPGVVVIEDDVWIAANAVILPDVIIGRGSIVGAGAVVTKSIDEYTIVGAVPAQIIRNRKQPRGSCSNMT